MPEEEEEEEGGLEVPQAEMKTQMTTADRRI
jgi:hypothetical protein